MKPKIITVAAIKGGTGKTTTAAALAFAGVKAGRRVLAVDLDAQSGLSIYLNGSLAAGGSYALIQQGAEIEDVIQTTASGVSLIAGNANLMALTSGAGSINRLRRKLEAVEKKFDLVIIDTAPAMGEAQNNAFAASSGVLIPIEASADGLQGMFQTLNIVRQAQQANPALRVLGVVIANYSSNGKIFQIMREAIADKAQEAGVPYLGEIRRGVAVLEARATRKSIFEASPKCNPAQDYLRLFRAIEEGKTGNARHKAKA